MKAALARVMAAGALLVVVGLLPWLSTRDPALTVLRARSAERDPDPRVLARIRADLGLDDGPVAVFGGWVHGLLHGDAGTSWVSGAPVLPGVVAAVGVSLTLMAGALAVALVVGVLVNSPVLAGVRTRGHGVAAAILTAVPEFLLGSVLLIVLATWLGWLPPYGWTGPQHLLLPALALGIPAGGLLGRLARDAMAVGYGEPWLRTWEAAGFRPASLGRGVARRALPPLAPQFGLVLVGLSGGAITVETLFAVPGLGRLTHSAALAQDLPVLQAGVLALVVLAVTAGVLADLTRRALLGPAARAGAFAAARPEPRPRRRTWLVPAVLLGVLAVPVLAGLGRDPVAIDGASRLAPPSFAKPLGADALGRDVLARLAHGAFATAGTAVLVAAAALALALLVSLLPRFATGAAEVTNAVPPVLAGLLVAAATGPSWAGAALAVLVVAWAPLAVEAVSRARQEFAATYVEAAVAAGATRWWLLRRHVLPAILLGLVRYTALRVPGIALALASLGFLGLGAAPPTPEWGLVLAEAMPYVERAPWAALAPAFALAILGALAVSLAGVTRVRGHRTAFGGKVLR